MHKYSISMGSPPLVVVVVVVVVVVYQYYYHHDDDYHHHHYHHYHHYPHHHYPYYKASACSSESSIAIEAPLGNAIGSGEQCSPLTGGVGRDVGPIPAKYLLVRKAGDGCGLSHSTRIESDDVVDRSNI